MPGGASRDESASSARRCAARAPRSRTGAWEVRAPCVLLVVDRKKRIVHQGGWELLSNRQHAVERDAGPVLLIVGNDDAVVDASLDQLIENPEQVVRRDAEHGRAEAAELIERDDGTVGSNFPRQAI